MPIWNGPAWNCQHYRWVNADIREICRNCGHDSNAGEFPYYNPLPPYEGHPDHGKIAVFNREENMTENWRCSHGKAADDECRQCDERDYNTLKAQNDRLIDALRSVRESLLAALLSGEQYINEHPAGTLIHDVRRNVTHLRNVRDKIDAALFS